MAELVLHVHDINEDGKDYSFTLSEAWLTASLAEAGLRPDPKHVTGALEVHAQKNDAEYLVNGRIDADLVTDCARCLEEAKVPAHVSFAYLFSRNADAARLDADAAEGDEDEAALQREPFKGHEIVLDDLVREHIVLECPMQPLCSPDCKGIPVPAHVRPPEDVFGPSDGSIDPRLAPLMRLRDKVPPK
jgi:uncharacterized protein